MTHFDPEIRLAARIHDEARGTLFRRAYVECAEPLAPVVELYRRTLEEPSTITPETVCACDPVAQHAARAFARARAVLFGARGGST